MCVRFSKRGTRKALVNDTALLDWMCRSLKKVSYRAESYSWLRSSEPRRAATRIGRITARNGMVAKYG